MSVCAEMYEPPPEQVEGHNAAGTHTQAPDAEPGSVSEGTHVGVRVTQTKTQTKTKISAPEDPVARALQSLKLLSATQFNSGAHVEMKAVDMLISPAALPDISVIPAMLAPLCKYDHVMEVIAAGHRPWNYGGVARCDTCRAVIPSTVAWYHCEKCTNFDMCPSCAVQLPVFVWRHAEQHADSKARREWDSFATVSTICATTGASLAVLGATCYGVARVALATPPVVGTVASALVLKRLWNDDSVLQEGDELWIGGTLVAVACILLPAVKNVVIGAAGGVVGGGVGGLAVAAGTIAWSQWDEASKRHQRQELEYKRLAAIHHQRLCLDRKSPKLDATDPSSHPSEKVIADTGPTTVAADTMEVDLDGDDADIVLVELLNPQPFVKEQPSVELLQSAVRDMLLATD